MFSDSSDNGSMDPRVTALMEALQALDQPEVDFRWAAVMDFDGLVLASVPDGIENDMAETIASTAHLMSMGERAMDEVEFGKWRFTLLTGSRMQQLVMHLNNEVALSVGVGTRTPLHRLFASVRDTMPALIRSLDISSRKFSEPNTMIMRREDMDRLLQSN